MTYTPYYYSKEHPTQHGQHIFWWDKYKNHHASWNHLHLHLPLLWSLPALRGQKAAGREGRKEGGRREKGRGMGLSRTYPLEPADVVFNPFFPWGSVNQQHVRDENKHPTFLLSNSSSWREMCGYNWDLPIMCKFYSPERCKHESSVESLSSPPRQRKY